MDVTVHFIKTAGTLIFVVASSIWITACGQAVYHTATLPTPTGSVTLTWDSPTTNTDDSELMDLAGYWIFCTPETGSPLFPIKVPDPLITQRVINGLIGVRWLFEVSAFNFLGYQSDRSSPIDTVVIVNQDPPP